MPMWVHVTLWYRTGLWWEESYLQHVPGINSGFAACSREPESRLKSKSAAATAHQFPENYDRLPVGSFVKCQACADGQSAKPHRRRSS